MACAAECLLAPPDVGHALSGQSGGKAQAQLIGRESSANELCAFYVARCDTLKGLINSTMCGAAEITLNKLSKL